MGIIPVTAFTSTPKPPTRASKVVRVSDSSHRLGKIQGSEPKWPDPGKSDEERPKKSVDGSVPNHSSDRFHKGYKLDAGQSKKSVDHSDGIHSCDRFRERAAAFHESVESSERERFHTTPWRNFKTQISFWTTQKRIRLNPAQSGSVSDQGNSGLPTSWTTQKRPRRDPPAPRRDPPEDILGPLKTTTRTL